jgi:hypothetical protein
MGLTGTSDQYSLGIVSYEMLTGQVPFSGSAYDIMNGHTLGAVPSLREAVPDLPVSVEAAILRMLAKNPADRFPSMADALRAMGAVPLPDDSPAREALVRLAAVDARRAAMGGALLTPVSPVPRPPVAETPAEPSAPLAPPLARSARRARGMLFAGGALAVAAALGGVWMRQPSGAPVAVLSPAPPPVATDSGADSGSRSVKDTSSGLGDTTVGPPARPPEPTPNPTTPAITQAQLAGEARAVLERFAAAVGSMKLARVRAVVVDLSAADEEDFRESVRDLRAWSITVRSVRPLSGQFSAKVGTRTVVRAITDSRMVPKSGDEERSRDTTLFVLRREATGWTLLRPKTDE